jgi:hypothetical protein
MDTRYAKIKGGELGELILHQGDERRDHQRRSAECDRGELVAERLPCSSWHDEQQVPARDGSAADGFLIGAELGESEDGPKKLGEVVRIGLSSQRRKVCTDSCFHSTEEQ